MANPVIMWSLLRSKLESKDGNCSFNISNSELETFNQQIADGVESPFGYDDALAAATINTKGLVADSVSEAAGTVTKEFFSGKFNFYFIWF